MEIGTMLRESINIWVLFQFIRLSKLW